MIKASMQCTLFIGAFFFIVSSSCSFGEEVSLSLNEAILLALRDNRSILLKAEEINKARSKLSEKKADHLPSLTFIGTQQRYFGLLPEDTTNTTTQASIRQYLYKGGSIINNVAKSKYDLEATQAAAQTTTNEIIFQVTQAFYTLVLAKEFTTLNENILKNSIAHRDSLQARYNHGQNSENDMRQITSSLENVKAAYEESANQVSAVQSLLRNLLYLDEQTDILPVNTVIYDPKDLLYDEGFLQALENRPEIKEYEAKEKANKKAIDIAKAEGRPTIWAAWDYYSRSHVINTSTKNWNDSMALGLTISWPVFDGWATKAKVDQAIYDLKQAQLTKQKIIKDIALELKNAYIALKDAIAQVRTAEVEILSYEANFSTIKEKYAKGMSSTLDFDDANLSYQVALFTKNQAVYNYLVAHSAFEKATGGL